MKLQYHKGNGAVCKGQNFDIFYVSTVKECDYRSVALAFFRSFAVHVLV